MKIVAGNKLIRRKHILQLLLFLLIHFYVYAQQSPMISFRIEKGKVVYVDTSALHLGVPKTPHKKTTQSNLSEPITTTRTSSITISTTITGSTCGYGNGSLVAIATGGTFPYTYYLSGFWTQNTGNFPNVPGGSYTITVTDAIGQVSSIPVLVPNSYNSPQLSISSYTSASGCTTADASATLTATGGTPPYTYSYDHINYQASNTFTNLYPGIYYFTVKDANGCIHEYMNFVQNFFISSSCSNGIGLGFSLLTCGNNGDINLTAYGPNPPYSFSLDGINYQSSGNFTNLGPGYYTAYFKDAAGTVQILMVPIFEYCAINIDFITVSASCGQNDGSLTVNASNGAAPYTYTIDGINYQSSNTFSGLAPGIYSVTVKDANDVKNSSVTTVYDRCPMVTASATGESCAGADGTITATATNGTAPYQYSIDGINFQSSNIFTGLATGNYTVTLRDALGFTSTVNVFVPDVCIAVTASAGSTTCGNNNGTITASASNGTTPYQYSIDGINFQFANTFSGLAAGTYTITAKDGTGALGTTSITITDIPGPQITTATTPTSCSGNDGTVTITNSGGTPGFQYSLDGSPYQSSDIFSNLSPATYAVSIMDANGCIATQSVTVTSNCPIPSATVTNETCSSSNGIISVTVTGGTAPYQYSTDGINFQASNIFTGLAVGTYTITVKDALNTTNTTTAIIQNICPTVSATITNGYCGTANASISATGANGTAPYQYSIDGVNFQTTGVFSNLITGTYTITIRDVNGLTNTTTASVSNFPGPSINAVSTAASCLNNNGTITINLSGGSTPLQYSIDGTNYQSASQFTGIATGNYNAVVKDVNGCTASQSVIIALNNDLVVNAGGANNLSVCEGTSINIPASSNGSTFNWTPSATLNNTAILNPTASPAVTTIYTLTATLGICTKSDNVTINVLPAPVADAGADVTICYGQDVQLSGSGGSGYSWSPATYLDNAQSQQPTVQHPSNTITYSLLVTGNNGCKSLNNARVTVNVTAPALVNAGRDTSIVMGQPFQLQATDVNNSGFTQYSWSPSNGLDDPFIQNPVATIQQDMVYTVTAATAAGCEGTDAIHLKVYKGPEIYVPSAFTPNNDGRNDILRVTIVGIKEFRYFKIFNRWGQVVFTTKDPSTGWNGNVKTGITETGTFIWMAEGIDDHGNKIFRKGTVMLIK